MTIDNKASSYPQDSVRKGRNQNIIDSFSQSPVGQGLGQAFNLDAEDRRDVLYSRREAKGKQAIPTRAVQTLSQNPLVESIRQYATVTKNPVDPQPLTPCQGQKCLIKGTQLSSVNLQTRQALAWQ